MTTMAGVFEGPTHTGDVNQKEAQAGILPSHGVSLDVPGTSESGRPPIVHHLSMPTYQSPLRHHQRNTSFHREVKETLNARSEYTNSQDDGKSQHHINQYIIGEEIGRGSFGAVHLATDQYGNEFAVKEFSKSRLRKRAQSNILRRPPAFRRPGHLAAGVGFNAPLHRHSADDIHVDEEASRNPLYLIREEIAIMKKLNHPNLVQLIEVLDDPAEDSLYMVLEMCKKGVIMKVGLDERADPYDAESCRCWFRDLILGIEYLHAQGVVHRDIKPDNLLLTEDDVLKIVDFGVSEMFEKQSDMRTAKSAGSPAFMPPELCVAKHGDISGKAADIWSMGVSLYCLRFGRIPFERPGVLELYEAIKHDPIDFTPEDSPQFVDLMEKLLERDPQKRITMKELRNHPWVTKDGSDPLLSEEENTSDLVEPPTESEINRAITSTMNNLLTVMKAVNKFKSLLWRRRPELMTGILGQDVRIVQPPLQLNSKEDRPLERTHSFDMDNRRPIEGALASEGVHRDVEPHDTNELIPLLHRMDSAVSIEPTALIHSNEQSRTHHHGHLSTDPANPPAPLDTGRTQSSGERGHAHDPMDEEPLWLGIGPGEDIDISPETPICAESPTAAEFNIYDTAYQREVERIREAKGHQATVYLTRRVDSKKAYQEDEYMVDAPKDSDVAGQPHAGWKSLLDAAREKQKYITPPVGAQQSHDRGLGGLAAHAGDSAKAVGEQAVNKGQQLTAKGGSTMIEVVKKAMDRTGAQTGGNQT